MTDGPRSGSAEELLRNAARDALAGSIFAVDSASIWAAVIEGRSKIAAEFSEAGWSFLVIRDCTREQARRLAPRSLEILEQVLLGAEPKVVSIDRRLAPSTIAGSLKHAYETIGLRCKPSRVPLLLVALVHAAKGHGQIESGRCAKFEHGPRSFQVVCMPSPDRLFDRVLSPAEQCVIRMRLEGMSHAEIAAQRHTSRRTVANQIATAFHRLGISCRADLMELLIAPQRVSPRPRRPAPVVVVAAEPERRAV